ncbi:uncharacterized protein LOC143611958 [Bidens hawaiensis]|uniref:uncharacterized protein LOC143611958 n=1 Tax=Bidens hawaiensis TaxID=980011 RepID=UPI00404B9686
MTIEECDFVSRHNNMYGNNYNPGWRNHLNFSWRDGANNQAPPGFNRRPYNQHQPSQPKPPYQNQGANTNQQPNSGSTAETLLTQLIESTDALNKLTEDRFLKNEVELRNQKAFLQNIKSQVVQLAQLLSERPPEGLPSNTITIPNTQANAITLRSGRTAINTSQVTPIQTEGETEVLDTPNTQPIPTPISKPAKEPEKPYVPPIPYPSHMKQEKMGAQYGKFLEIFKQLHINLPFIEAISQMPIYAKFLKEVLSNKRKLEELSHVILNEECSTILQNKLPKKMTDQGSFTIPCLIGNLFVSNALADPGASINLVPYTIFS